MGGRGSQRSPATGALCPRGRLVPRLADKPPELPAASTAVSMAPAPTLAPCGCECILSRESHAEMGS